MCHRSVNDILLLLIDDIPYILVAQNLATLTTSLAIAIKFASMQMLEHVYHDMRLARAGSSAERRDMFANRLKIFADCYPRCISVTWTTDVITGKFYIITWNNVSTSNDSDNFKLKVQYSS